MNNYKHLYIKSNQTIMDCLKKMDENKCKLLIIVDHQSKYQNLISIGDLQRGIINGFPLSTPIEKIQRNDYLVSYDSESKKRLKELMLSIRAEFMPILKSDGSILDVVFWNDIFEINKFSYEEIDIPVLIMAGGFGSRLKPLTNLIPKPLLPIGENTILEEIIERYKNNGCSEFLISVNYKADMIIDFVEKKGLSNVSFIHEDQPLGTAGSLNLIKDKIKGTFFVNNCDILIDEDYRQILKYHRENKNEITIVSAILQFNIPYGTIETVKNGQITSLNEKPDLTFKINTGMYVMESHLLDEIPENEFYHITDLIEKILKRNGKIGAFPISEKSWIDIGEWDKYVKLLKLNHD